MDSTYTNNKHISELLARAKSIIENADTIDHALGY